MLLLFRGILDIKVIDGIRFVMWKLWLVYISFGLFEGVSILLCFLILVLIGIFGFLTGIIVLLFKYISVILFRLLT